MNGPAIGIAVTSLSHFDVVYMAEGGYLWTPFARAGLYPEFASSIMFPKLMGDHVAMEMLLLSKKLSAEEANNCGFVNELFPAGEGFEAAVLARLAELPGEVAAGHIIVRPRLKSWSLAPKPSDFRVARRIETRWLSQGQ